MLPIDYAEPDAKVIEVHERRRPFLAWWEHREALVLTDPTRRSAASQCRVPGHCDRATPLNLLERKSTVKKLDSRAEELEQRVVPSILGSTLSAAVALPLPPDPMEIARASYFIPIRASGSEFILKIGAARIHADYRLCCGSQNAIALCSVRKGSEKGGKSVRRRSSVTVTLGQNSRVSV